MKQKSKIALLSGTTAVGLSSVLGVYFGLKDTSLEIKEKKYNNFGEKYFKNKILNDKNFLSRNILFGNDKNNIDELIKLDNLHYNSGKNKDFLKKNKKNLLSSDGKILINFSSKKNDKEIEKEYKEINLKLFNKLKELKEDKNIKGNIGVEFVKNVLNSTVEIKLFEVKGFNSKDNTLIDEFLKDLGNIEKPKNGWSLHKFIRMFTSETQFDDEMIKEFNFSGGQNFAKKWLFKDYKSKFDNGEFFVDIRGFDNPQIINPDKDLNFIKKLADEKIINTIQPSLDMKNKKLKIISRFYKTQNEDKKNGLYASSVTSNVETKVYNSAAIRTEFIEYDLTEFGDLNPIKGDRKENAEIIKKLLIGERSFAKWTDNKIVTIGLSTLKLKIPQLNSFVKQGMNLSKILNAKNDNDEFKFRDLFDIDITLDINNKKVTGKIHELILDIMQYDDLVNANTFIENAKQFMSQNDRLMSGEIMDKDLEDVLLLNFGDWNNILNLTWMDYKNGGHAKIYSLMSGLNSMYAPIIKVFNKRYPNASFEELEGEKDPIQELFIFLKDKKIISSNTTISDFIDGYKDILPTVFENIAKNDIEMPKSIIENLLSLVQLDLVQKNHAKISEALFKLFKEKKFSKVWNILGENKEERSKTLNLLLSSSTTIEGLGRILKNRKIEKESISIIFNFLKDSGIMPSSLLTPTIKEDIEIIYELFTKVESGKTSMEELFDFVDKSLKNGMSSNDLNSFKKVVSIFSKIFPNEFNALKKLLNSSKWNDTDSSKLAENLFNFVQTGLGGDKVKTRDSINAIIKLIKLGLNKSPGKELNDKVKWFDVKKMTDLFNEFLNNGINGIKQPSFMFLTNILSENIKEISSLYKKFNLNKDIIKGFEKLTSKLAHKIINGISSFDEIKILYDDFMNDPDNSELKSAMHKLINNKIEAKEKELLKINVYKEKNDDSKTNYEKIKEDIKNEDFLVYNNIANKNGQEQLTAIENEVKLKYKSLLKSTDKVIVKFYEEDSSGNFIEKLPTNPIELDPSYLVKHYKIEIKDNNDNSLVAKTIMDNLKTINESWSWTKDKYIKKLSYSGYIAPTGQETISSIWEMSFMDLINVFAKTNIIPIMEKSPLIKMKGLTSYDEFKQSFGTVFERLQVLYELDGNSQIDPSSLQLTENQMKQFMNFSTIHSLTYLIDNPLIQDIVIFNNIINPLSISASKTVINLLKTGLSGTKENWKTNIKNILDLTKKLNKLIGDDAISPSIPASTKKDLDKYTYGILEQFGMATKKADNSGYDLVDITTLEGALKLDTTAQMISNIFNKGINSTQSQNNLSSSEFDFIWELVQKFTSKTDENGDTIKAIPDSMPKIIKRLLIDKVGIKDLNSKEIKELLDFVSKVSPGSKSTIDLIKNNLIKFLIGNNKISLEDYVENINDYVNPISSKKESILLTDNSTNTFLSFELRIKNILKAKFPSSKIKIERIILSNKSVVLNKQTPIKFKVEFSRTENGIKNKLITDDLECKLSEEEKYNLKNIYDSKESKKTFENLAKTISGTKQEVLSDKLKLNFGNDLLLFKAELDKKNYKLVLLEGIDSQGQKLNSKTYLVVKKSINLSSIDLSTDNGLNFFKNINRSNKELNQTPNSFSIKDVDSLNGKNIIFREAKNKTNNFFGIIGVVQLEDSTTSDPGTMY